MNTAKKNLVLIIWFLYMLSIIMSALVLVSFYTHAHMCRDSDCKICSMVQSVDGIFDKCKRNVLIIAFISAIFVLMPPTSFNRVRFLFKISPVSYKTKQLI